MIRKLMSSKRSEHQEKENKRNFEIRRIETFSDGVFAFAVTLLIVSLEVPKSFEELLTTMRGFFAFGISFLLLVMIWNEQHRFFRNYGLDDIWTITLNGMLLFIVLFYVYPLKFLFTLIFSDQIYGRNKSPFTIEQSQIPMLMMIYALGFMAIYTLFFLMYLHASHKSAKLGLSPVEKFDCHSSMYRILIMVIAGFGSFITAFLINKDQVGLAGYMYFLIGPAIGIFFIRRIRIRRKLFPTIKSEQ
ncbi:MAG TPA: TMEM175 family protein [Puia sp.]|nr:TMEM175 family protein [Puia sp.]